MPQLSKVIEGRENWKAKAIQKAKELREERRAKKYYKERVTILASELEKADKELKLALVTIKDKKKAI
jgi:hypothetical protein